MRRMKTLVGHVSMTRFQKGVGLKKPSYLPVQQSSDLLSVSAITPGLLLPGRKALENGRFPLPVAPSLGSTALSSSDCLFPPLWALTALSLFWFSVTFWYLLFHPLPSLLYFLVVPWALPQAPFLPCQAIPLGDPIYSYSFKYHLGFIQMVLKFKEEH